MKNLKFMVSQLYLKRMINIVTSVQVCDGMQDLWQIYFISFLNDCVVSEKFNHYRKQLLNLPGWC